MTPEMFGTGGIGLVLLAIIGYLLKQNHADRKQYQDHIAEVEQRTSAAIADAKKSSAEEIARLNTKVDALTTLYEAERSARWAAEDKAATYKRLYELGSPAQGGTT